MPFTFSHPAIILPLNYFPRTITSTTGLVIGSVTPDFEYFIRMKVQSDYSHTIGGLFWFDLPMGIFLTFIFHNVVRDTLFRNFPAFLRSRLYEFEKLDWIKHFLKFWLTVIISVLIGASSHLLWDGFTHANGYFVEFFHSLSTSIFLLGYSIPIFKILQHASTLIGGIIILVVIYKLPRSKADDSGNPVLYWGIVLTIFSTIIIIRLIFDFNIHEYGNFIVTCIAAILSALVLTPLIIQKFGS